MARSGFVDNTVLILKPSKNVATAIVRELIPQELASIHRRTYGYNDLQYYSCYYVPACRVFPVPDTLCCRYPFDFSLRSTDSVFRERG